MLIKYKYFIDSLEVHPLYKDSLSKDSAMESDERFYRSSLNGNFKFLKSEFDFINNESIDHKFEFLIQKSNDGLIFSDYFFGYFYKTDCVFNEDDKIVETKISTSDQYSLVLSGMDKEFDLLKLAIPRSPIKIDKRPILQIYTRDSDTITCILGRSNNWEQQVSIVIDNNADLINIYKFGYGSSLQDATVSGSGIPQACIGGYTGKFQFNYLAVNEWHNKTEEYTLTYTPTGNSDQTDGYEYTMEIIQDFDSEILFRYTGWTNIMWPLNNDITMDYVPGSGASGSLSVWIRQIDVFSRWILDVDEVDGNPTYDLPVLDMAGDSRNYTKVYPCTIDGFTISSETQIEATKYGLADDGTYFVAPTEYDTGIDIITDTLFVPIFKSDWGLASTWYVEAMYNATEEVYGRKAYIMKDCMMIEDVIGVLLEQIDPRITHEGTTDYSQFLYGTNPLIDDILHYYNYQKIAITPKSNILAGEYDQSAQKAVITLKKILNMLKQTHQLFWFIDEDYKLRIEHISWFKNGGSYSGTHNIGADLTNLFEPRTGKSYAFGRNKYQFSKLNMPEQLTFAWADDSTEGFDGYSIDILSNFVEKGKIDSLNIDSFSSDIDYMLMNPEAFNQDGFAVMSVVNGIDYDLELPYIIRTFSDHTKFLMQNGMMSFVYLHDNFWDYDLPANHVMINKEEKTSINGISREKKQSIYYFSIEDPNPMELIKTGIGDGEIEKISINLHSRKVSLDLRYDT